MGATREQNAASTEPPSNGHLAGHGTRERGSSIYETTGPSQREDAWVKVDGRPCPGQASF